MVDSPKHSHPAAPHRVPPTRQQIIAQVLVSVVILISGVIIGSGGTILALRDRIIPARTTPVTEPGRDDTGHRTEGPANEIVSKWTGEYGLTEAQSLQARETLIDQFAAIHSLWTKFQTAEQTEREKLALAMKSILTEDQFTRWEADFRRMVQDMQRMRPFDPSRGGRGGPRPDWRPDRPRDPNDRREGWRSGPPRDPNGMRGDWQRDGFRGPGARRGDWGRDRSRDSDEMRGPRPPEGTVVDPNSSPKDTPQSR